MVELFRCTKELCILQLHTSYRASLIMVTIIRHVFINIFQTEHFSAVKFAKSYEKQMSFPVIPKSPRVWKKDEKIGLGSFKSSSEGVSNSNWVALWTGRIYLCQRASVFVLTILSDKYNAHWKNTEICPCQGKKRDKPIITLIRCTVCFKKVQESDETYKSHA